MHSRRAKGMRWRRSYFTVSIWVYGGIFAETEAENLLILLAGRGLAYRRRDDVVVLVWEQYLKETQKNRTQKLPRLSSGVLYVSFVFLSAQTRRCGS